LLKIVRRSTPVHSPSRTLQSNKIIGVLGAASNRFGGEDSAASEVDEFDLGIGQVSVRVVRAAGGGVVEVALDEELLWNAHG
jgi:hypothetical protein